MHLFEEKLSILTRALSKRRVWLLLGVIVIAVAAVVLVPHIVHAQDAAPIAQLAQPGFWVRLIARILLYFAQLFIRISLFFLALIIQVSAYNGYLNSDTVNIGWVMVRDITNMFFVVMLLLIAFGTILGIEQYEWKKTLVKFVFAAILVNFSRVICGILIDASQIIMNTFVNGIVATAGGNLINMFNLNGILRFHGNIEGAAITEPGVLTASVAGFMFAGMLMLTLAIFVFMLVARLVRLWILIVLSPLAFVLSATPLTQKYSGQWWSEFGDDLVTGPVLLFFIWLSFVSLGNGNINAQIAASSSIPDQNKIFADDIHSGQDASILGNETLPTDFQSAGISDSLRWNSMANFAIAIGMLFAGAFVASQIGGSSGSALSVVGAFGKRVATVATGYAAGRWLYEKSASAAKSVAMAPIKGVGAALNYTLIEPQKMRLQNEVEAIKGWYHGQAFVSPYHKQLTEQIRANEKALGTAKEEDRPEVQKNLDLMRTQLAEKDAEQKKALAPQTDEEFLAQDKRLAEIKDLKANIAASEAALGTTTSRQQRDALRTNIETAEKRLADTTGKGAIGWLARRRISIEKNLEKTKKQAEVRRKILWKSSGSVAGGRLFMHQDRMLNAQDRIERGWLQAEEMRSHAKDEEGETLGKMERLSKPRFKDGHYEDGTNGTKNQGTMMQRIDEHEMKAQQYKSAIEKMGSEAKLHLVLDPSQEGHMKAIDGSTITYGQVLEQQSMAKLFKDRLSKEEERSLNNSMASKVAAGVYVDEFAGRLEAGLYATEAEKEQMQQAAAAEQKALGDLNKTLQAQFNLEQDVGRTEQEILDLEHQQEIVKNDPTKGDAAQIKAEIEKKKEDNIKRSESILNLNPKIEKQQEAYEVARTNARNVGKKWKDMADILRGDDAEAATKVADQMAASLQNTLDERDADGNFKIADSNERKKITEDISRWKNVGEKAKSGGTAAWAMGASTAKAAEASRAFRYKNNLLLSNAENRTIWNKRGVSTPNTALTELIQEMEKNFTEMNYDDFVRNARGTLMRMVEKKENHEPLDEADKAALAGLFKRGFNESWVDDVIIGVMTDQAARAKIGKALGWTNLDFSADRIGDVETFFATGDLKTTSENVVLRELFDEGANAKNEKKKLSVAQVLQGARTGKFENENGEFSKEDVEEYRKNIEDHLKSLGRVLTADQKEMFDTLFSSKEGDAAKRAEYVDNYLKSMRDNQASLQFFGNLRNEAIKNNHAENAGWALSHDVGGGEALYVTSGTRMARDHVFGDLNKTDTRQRAASHSHVAADLAVGDFGQVIKRIRRNDLAIVRTGITNSQSWGGTNARWVKNYTGFASGDNLADHMNEAGELLIGHSDNSQAAWKQTNAAEFAQATAHLNEADPAQKAQKKKIEEALTAQNVVKEVFMPQMETNMQDFLITSATASNVNPIDALTQGKMSMRIPYLKDGKVHEFECKNINDLITAMRDGTFGFRATGIPNFKPTGKKGGEGGGPGGGTPGGAPGGAPAAAEPEDATRAAMEREEQEGPA